MEPEPTGLSSGNEIFYSHYFYAAGISRYYSWPTSLMIICIYRVSQEECARLREDVPYVKVYRYNSKHLYPKLNFTEIMARENRGLLAVLNTATCTADVSRDRANVLETGMQC